ncbi:MAG: HAD-IIIA family hydrolase [Candidatus Hydrogenedentes bacterium]|nr:HAD-IIIA family hydrolase [Candidatus Hydrogenedentota bacterium]
MDFIDGPAKATLLPRASEAIRRLNDAGLSVVVVSNQSGVARGRFDEATVCRVNDRVQELLHEQGARVDAFYYCPYLEGDQAVVARYRKRSRWRIDLLVYGGVR